MIQRIQSLFLLLTGASFFLQFVFNFATSSEAVPKLMMDKIYNVMDHPVLIAMTCLGGGISVFAIFLFRNRPLQLRMGYILIILGILLPLVSYLLIFNEGVAFDSKITIDDGLGMYLPFIGIISAILANRFIQKDNRLVKSMDRLR